MDRLSDYDYLLPESAIAQEPLADRAASRLLWLHKETGEVEHRVFRDVPQLLEPGDLLVLNDTRVTALRLFGNKPTGGQVEVLLLKELEPQVFVALARPGKRLQPGAKIYFLEGVECEVVQNLEDGQKKLRFNVSLERLQAIGQVPLPPYINTALGEPERYQTVYATVGGSAAAPTAGLHFTSEILSELEERGVGIARVTLDVGLDTFRPVQAEVLSEHHMHGERCSVPPETAEAVATCTGRVIAVGTTAVRTLESLAEGPRKLGSGTHTTSIFIRPGYRFQIVDGMFTNFHLPRTTMLMMISAMAGRENVLYAYQEALERQYRFLSFGDAMLIL